MCKFLYFHECIMNFMLACTRMNISPIAELQRNSFIVHSTLEKKAAAKLFVYSLICLSVALRLSGFFFCMKIHQYCCEKL